MDIHPLGLSSFKIKGKHLTVVTDPFEPEMVGLKFPKHVEADVVTVSHQHHDHNAVGLIEGSPFVIAGPGEYEIKGSSIIGFRSFHDTEGGAKRGKNTIYRMEIDGVSVAHLGDLGHTLASEGVEELDGVDIVLIPTGGVYSLAPQQASEVIAELEPKIVIPMHYGRKELNPKVFGELSPLGAFLKEMGKESVAPQPKLTISKDKLPAELQVIVLE